MTSPTLLQPSSLERARLLDKLYEAATHKLTLIAAPPGYGKTTLVTQFTHRTAVAIIWQSLEKKDHDLPILFEHARTAVSTLVPDILDASPPPGASVSEMAAFITDHLPSEELIYIIDDVHLLIDAPSAEAWLRALIASLPATCHLILIGRALPPLSIGEMIARGQVLAIGQAELSFTAEEVNALAHRVGRTLHQDDAQKIIARLSGWPAGIALALQPLPTEFDALLSETKTGPEALFTALAEVILRSQPLLLQEFLLHSSTLMRITPTLCQAALHLQDSLDYLNEAVKRNLFVASVPGGVAYHPLFREFLQEQLHARNPSLFAQLHADAARWFESDNRLEEAFEHYMAAGYWQDAAAIADQTAHTFLGRGQVETLLDWRLQLGSVGVRVARLSYFCTRLYSERYDYQTASAAAAESEAEYRRQGNHVGLIQVALLNATIANQRGDYLQAISVAEPFINAASTPANLQGFALAIIGMAHLHLGTIKAAVTCLEAALPLWRATGDSFAIAHLLVDLGLAYLYSGCFHEAATSLQEALELRRALGNNVGIAAALNNLALHYHLLGEYDQAARTVQDGLQAISGVAETRDEAYLLSTLGDVQRDRGCFDEAAIHYHRALELAAQSEPILRSTLLVSLATLRRWQGKLKDAHRLALEAVALSEKHQLGRETLLAQIALAAVQIWQGDTEIARRLLEISVKAWKQDQPPQLSPGVALLAHIALLDGDLVAASQYLQLAGQQVSHPAVLQPMIAEIVHSPLLKTHLQRQPHEFTVLIEGSLQLERAIEAVSPPEKSSKHVAATPAYSLRVWTLGHESVERDANAVPIPAWQAATARELFFYLLLKGRTARDQLWLKFWPDDNPRKIRQKFHTTLHRIREAVGTNVIRFEDEHYFINPNIDIWCDVQEFERVVQQAKFASPLLVHTEVLWHRAIELYRGDFLSSFDADWIFQYRETLSRCYVDALLALANCLGTRGNPQEAILLLKQALEIDPYREDLHRELLASYAASGEPSLVYRHLNKLDSFLKAELGIGPSEETLRLVQHLVG
jgi:LuxR family transcriptional regulator, maltose regulon positive regulatory protein